MTEIKKKRVYDERADSDGFRILVDRLWPRGVKKEDLPYDLWAKEITPTDGLRKAFNHEPKKFGQFHNDYLHELAENEATDNFVKTVKEELKKRNVTLLYAAKDEDNNHVVVLIEWLNKQLK